MRLCKSSVVFERPLSEWPLFFNPASHSFLQKWLIYALSESRQIVYKKQCSIRDAEGAACQWHAFSTDRSGAETARPVDVRPVQILSHRRKRTDTMRCPFFHRNYRIWTWVIIKLSQCLEMFISNESVLFSHLPKCFFHVLALAGFNLSPRFF